MDINVIGVPIFYGADRKGPEHAPAKLRDKNVIAILEGNNHNVYDLGNIHVPEIKEYNKYYSHDNLKYLAAIKEINTNLAHAVYSSVKAESFPLIIGGDHSVGLGSISGMSKAHDRVAVIWMDAHGDINTQDTSASGNIHGMPIAKAIGIGHEELGNVYFEGQKVAPEDIYILGARDLDEGEIKTIEELKVNTYGVEAIREKGIAAVISEIMVDIKGKGIEAVHLSFDLDFIDAKFVPGTGTPVGEGMNVEETKDLLKGFAATSMIKSMDFVELNTLLDKDDITADLSIALLDWTFKHLR